MKVSLRTILLTTAALFMSTAAVHAGTKRTTNAPAAPNVQDVAGGALSLTFSPAFTSTMLGGGIVTSFHGTTQGADSARLFRIYAGMVDVNTGFGEFTSVGNIEFDNGTTTVELRHLTIDTSGQTPVITAELMLDGAVLGRVPVFTLAAGPFPTMVTTPGFQTQNYAFSVADSFVPLFNSFWPRNVMTLGLGAGTSNFTAIVGTIQ